MKNQRMMGRGRAWAAVLAVAASTLALGCARTEVVSVDGSSTVFLMSGAAAERFDAVEPNVKVVVGKSGTGGGFKKFAAGEIDVCGASRKITPEEVQACEAAGIDFVELEIAFDGLAVVVNPENDWCDALTVEQLRTIWRKESEGAIMKWSDVDPEWPALALELYGPGDDSGTFDYFTQVINGEEKNSRSDYSPSEDDNALVTGVAGDKGALGYFGYGYYAENKDKLKLLAIDAGDGPVLPDPDTVREGTYRPLSRPLYIYVRTSALERPEAAKFVEYYVDHAAELAPQVGYVAVPDEIARESRARLDAALQGETTAAVN